MKLVIDSNILVSSLDPKDIFYSECYPIFERLLDFEIEALCPVIVLVETICALRRRTNSEETACGICKDLTLLPSINWLDINIEVAEKACIIGAKTGLKGGDAIGGGYGMVARRHRAILVTGFKVSPGYFEISRRRRQQGGKQKKTNQGKNQACFFTHGQPPDM